MTIQIFHFNSKAMKDIILFEKNWGNLIFSIDWKKIDLLPRVTASSITNAFIVNVGFFAFTLNLIVWGKSMRKFNLKYDNKG